MKRECRSHHACECMQAARDRLEAGMKLARAWLEADEASTVPRPHEDHIMHLTREAFAAWVAREGMGPEGVP